MKTSTWFQKQLDKFKGDPLFEAEGRIFELEEHIAKAVPVTWVMDYDIDTAQEWEREGLRLLQKGVTE